MTKLRRIELKNPANKPSETGYFHGFFTHAYWDGGNFQTSLPVALVEYETGDIKMVTAELVKFISRPKETI